MLGQPFATILARTDPFDLAQGAERYVRSLSGDQVRVVIRAARAHFNEAYSDEFLPLADEPDDERLKSAFAHALKSNLRAIPLFGPDFCEGVMAQVPGDRAVGIGEEGYRFRQIRPAAFGIIALALLIGSAAAEHVWSNARANAQAPVVLETPPPIVMPSAVPVAAATPMATAPAKQAAPRVRQRTPARAATPAPATPPAATAAAAVAAAPAVATPPPAAPQPHPKPRAVHRTAPPGRGVKTIVLAGSTPEPSPEATPVDVTDMPRAYTDATPLPHEATAAPAQVNTDVGVPTPTPGPNRYWLHSTIRGTLKTLNNFNPFKHHSGPDPSPSPKGPQPQ